MLVQHLLYGAHFPKGFCKNSSLSRSTAQRGKGIFRLREGIRKTNPFTSAQDDRRMGAIKAKSKASDRACPELAERSVRLTRASHNRLRSRGALPLKLDFDLAAIFVRHFEHGARLQVHEAGYKDFGDLSDAGVVGVDIVVKELAAVGNAFFELRDPILQLEEVFVDL